MELNKALEKLKEVRAIADNPVVGDFRTRPGREAAQRAARMELDGLSKDFRKDFKSIGFALLSSGSEKSAGEFMALAEERVEILSLDFWKLFGEMYAEVAANVGPSREFGIAAFTALTRGVRQLGVQLGLTSVPTMNYRSSVVVSTEADVVKEANSYLTEFLGADFIASLIELQAANAVMDSNLVGDTPVLPVLVYNLPTDLVSEVSARVFSGRALVLPSVAPVSEETVVEVLNQIKKRLKKK